MSWYKKINFFGLGLTRAGRGSPSIDSLKEISSYFSVSIDDLLLGFVDLFSLMLIFLPLYPKPVNGYIYSVNLFGYVGNNTFIIKIYWALFASLTIIGIVKILMVCFKVEQGKKIITSLSVGLSIIAVLFLAMAREPYAITVMFLLLLKKAVCFINKSSQANKILVRSSVNRSMGIYSH